MYASLNSPVARLGLTSLRLKRGLHDINNAMVFHGSPGFIFHDSRGFEAGGTDELEGVKAFIATRANRTELKDHIHAIWFVERC